MDDALKTVYVDCGGKDFLLPYIRRELSDCEIITRFGDVRPDYAVLLSDTDIYADVSGATDIDETAPLDESSDYALREKAFRDLCAQNGLEYTVLRLSNVVATGMGGFPRRLVQGIARGTFMHIEGNEARLSTVHGVDVAVAVRLTLGLPACVYNVTDAVDPSLFDFAEALARRLNGKRIFRVKAKWARWLIPASVRRRQMSTKTFSSLKLRRTVPFEPHSVTDYLTTHVYDDASL